jgi:hypothetical protein
MTQPYSLETFLSVVLATLAVTTVSDGQSTPPVQSATQAPSKLRAAAPVTMTECEGINNCATWTFLGPQGNGQWPTGELANLNYTVKDGTIVIYRADPTGPSAGLRAVYTGSGDGDGISGKFESSWPGHWEKKSGHWYAISAASVSLPPVMHFCALNCMTLTLDRGRYVASPRYSIRLGQWIPVTGPQDSSSTWIVESFKTESVVLRRHDSAVPATGLGDFDAVYTGRISKEGNSLVFTGANAGSLRLAWGTALNTVPGSNCERDGSCGQQPSVQQAQALQDNQNAGLLMLLLLGAAMSGGTTSGHDSDGASPPPYHPLSVPDGLTHHLELPHQ